MQTQLILVLGPSTVDHLGVYFYVDQQIGVAQPYTVEVEVQFEFKKSFIANAVSQVHALPAILVSSTSLKTEL